jgi:hypothetical protein
MPIAVRQNLIALLVILGGSAIVFSSVWLVERRLCRGSIRSFPIGSMILTSISILIAVLSQLPLPGAFGPVQYWAGDSTGMLVFRIRGCAMFLLLLSPLVCGWIGKSRLESWRQHEFGWLFAAVSSYLVAWQCVMIRGFFPTV